MKSFSSFTKSSPSAVLMLGAPGSGKTTTATMLGHHPYIIDIDNNLDGPFRFHTERKNACHASFDTPHINEDGSLVPRKDRWLTMNKRITAAITSDPTIDVIVVSGLSGLVGYALDEVRRQQNVIIGDPMIGTKDGQMERQHWGAFVGLMRQWFLSMRAIGKTLVVEGHINLEKDEITGIDRLFVNVPGQFRNEIAGLFTDAWYFYIDQVTEKPGTAPVLKRTIRTVPQGDRETTMGLKSGLQLPPKMEVDYAKLNTALGF